MNTCFIFSLDICASDKDRYNDKDKDKDKDKERDAVYDIWLAVLF